MIILVLLLLFILPLFQDTTWFNAPTQGDWGLYLLVGIYDTGDMQGYNIARDIYITANQGIDYPVALL